MCIRTWTTVWVARENTAGRIRGVPPTFIFANVVSIIEIIFAVRRSKRDSLKNKVLDGNAFHTVSLPTGPPYMAEFPEHHPLNYSCSQYVLTMLSSFFCVLVFPIDNAR